MLHYTRWTERQEHQLSQDMKKTNHLICQEQGSLKAELSWTKIEEIFKTWPKQLHYHDVVVAFCAPPFHCWNANCNSNTSASDVHIPNQMQMSNHKSLARGDLNMSNCQVLIHILLLQFVWCIILLPSLVSTN